MWLRVSCFVALLLLVGPCVALDNGLARTPPMGWLSWERFRCILDCATYPDSCISEKLYRDMADRLAADGFAAAGYNFVNVDDCWAELERDSSGRMVPDKKRFPNGIKGLADYVHAKGLKLGLYTDIGTKTCGGFPGSKGHFEIDAQTFASWGIDSLKVDGCYASASDYPVDYPAFGRSLGASGRPIVYYCSWPAYIEGSANFTQIAQYCNGWRSYDDIQDSSDSLYSIINWWGKNGAGMIAAAGPGAWNDADMLLAGDFGFSYYQAQMQMGVWAIIASPLFMSNDLRRIDPQSTQLLQNREIIAINQDPLGRQGGMVQSLSNGSVQWWTRSLANGDMAVLALCQRSDMGTFFHVSAPLASLGWKYGSAAVRDVYNKRNLASVHGNLTLTVGPNVSSMVRLSRSSQH